MILMQRDIQEQLSDNAMKLNNMLIHKFAAVEEDLKGLQEEVELRRVV